MRFDLVILLMLLGFSLAAPGRAAAAAEEVRTLSLSEALTLGEQNIPRLVRARAEQRVVESRRAGAGMWLTQNPYASLLVGRRTERTSDPVATGTQLQFHIEQALEIAGQRWARLAAVDAQVAVAEAETAFSRIEARALLKTFYVQAALAEQRVAVSKSREELADRLFASARARLELGATGELETNLAQIELGRVRADRVQAEADAETRLTALRILCGLSPHARLRLESHQAEPPTLPAAQQQLPTLHALAESERADLLAIKRQQRSLLTDGSRLRREVVPNLVLSFDWQRDLPGQEFFGGTIGITLPVWNRNQGPLAQLTASELLRRADERLLRTRIFGEVSLAHRKLELLRAQVGEFKKDVLPPAERNIDLLRRGWQAGKFDLFRVITASRELAETRLRLLDLLESLWLAAIELERAVGVPLLNGVQHGVQQ